MPFEASPPCEVENHRAAAAEAETRGGHPVTPNTTTASCEGTGKDIRRSDRRK